MCFQLLDVILPLLKHLSQQKDVRPALYERFHMPEWFQKQGIPSSGWFHRTKTVCIKIRYSSLYNPQQFEQKQHLIAWLKFLYSINLYAEGDENPFKIYPQVWTVAHHDHIGTAFMYVDLSKLWFLCNFIFMLVIILIVYVTCWNFVKLLSIIFSINVPCRIA